MPVGRQIFVGHHGKGAHVFDSSMNDYLQCRCTRLCAVVLFVFVQWSRVSERFLSSYNSYFRFLRSLCYAFLDNPPCRAYLRQPLTVFPRSFDSVVPRNICVRHFLTRSTTRVHRQPVCRVYVRRPFSTRNLQPPCAFNQVPFPSGERRSSHPELINKSWKSRSVISSLRLIALYCIPIVICISCN